VVVRAILCFLACGVIDADEDGSPAVLDGCGKGKIGGQQWNDPQTTHNPSTENVSQQSTIGHYKSLRWLTNCDFRQYIKGFART
jgi:hypothetical protein